MDKQPPIMVKPSEQAKHYLCNPKFLDWLEKMKAEHNSLKRIVDGLVDMGIVEVYDDRLWSTDYNQFKDKLEAVKIHRENFRHSSYIEWLRELDKILKIEK